MSSCVPREVCVVKPNTLFLLSWPKRLFSLWFKVYSFMDLIYHSYLISNCLFPYSDILFLVPKTTFLWAPIYTLLRRPNQSPPYEPGDVCTFKLNILFILFGQNTCLLFGSKFIYLYGFPCNHTLEVICLVSPSCLGKHFLISMLFL